MSEKAYSRQEVVGILQAALAKVSHDDDRTLHGQLTDLVQYMDSLRHELAQLRSMEINHMHIPSATDELDAVVGETAAATGQIMDACERLQKHVSDAPEDVKNAVGADVTAIFEACSFQDITGQRITKVIKALKNIEKKVADILAALGQQHDAATATLAGAPAAAEQQKGDAALLNGPQLGGPEVSQEDIDKLLASFD